MILIEGIREKVVANAFEFSQHAVDQTILRHISVQEIRDAIANGKVIEDYPDDKYGPSCLILGFAVNSKAIHVNVAIPPGLWLRSLRSTSLIQRSGSTSSSER